jgi:hypothetical protein
MSCSIKNPAYRRFSISAWLSVLLVVLLSVGDVLWFRLGHLHGPLAYLVAVLPALPIFWVIYEAGRWVALEKDEFLRLLLIQCVLGGTGGTLATTTVWGWLETFKLAPHLFPGLVYTIFWLFAALSYPFVSRRYR